jgi:hypothetical protein
MKASAGVRGPRCAHAAINAGGVRPRDGGLLPRSGAGAGARGRTRELGWASFPAGARSEVGGPIQKKFLFFLFSQITAHKSPFLSNQKSFSKSDSKTKVAQNFLISNFANRSKAKIQIDFKLGI